MIVSSFLSERLRAMRGQYNPGMQHIVLHARIASSSNEYAPFGQEAGQSTDRGTTQNVTLFLSAGGHLEMYM